MEPTNGLQQFGQGVSRGFWAGGLGAPADMGNALLNLLIAGGGYAGHKTGLLDRPPDLLGPPVGGSEWIAEHMRRGGLLADTPGSAADTAGNFTGGLLGLLAGAKPDVGRPVNALMRLARAPATGKIAGLLSDANASKFVGREAPKTQQRDFSLDYPNRTALGPDGSRITTDIDGRTLASGPIAGRRVVGGNDEALGSAHALDTAKALGVPIQASRVDALPRGTVGVLDWLRGRWEPGTVPPARADATIKYSQGLDAYGQERVISHELGHLLDKVAGTIKQDGLSSELGRLYSELNTRGWVSKWQKGSKPQDFKYVGDDVKRELMAEAIHAYRTNPNYLKTVAPKTAAAIRAAVNPNPLLNKYIQFNSLAPAAGAGLLGAGLFANDTNELPD
jgi:hypothetical protein